MTPILDIIIWTINPSLLIIYLSQYVTRCYVTVNNLIRNLDLFLTLNSLLFCLPSYSIEFCILDWNDWISFEHDTHCWYQCSLVNAGTTFQSKFHQNLLLNAKSLPRLKLRNCTWCIIQSYSMEKVFLSFTAELC